MIRNSATERRTTQRKINLRSGSRQTCTGQIHETTACTTYVATSRPIFKRLNLVFHRRDGPPQPLVLYLRYVMMPGLVPREAGTNSKSLARVLGTVP